MVRECGQMLARGQASPSPHAARPAASPAPPTLHASTETLKLRKATAHIVAHSYYSLLTIHIHHADFQPYESAARSSSHARGAVRGPGCPRRHIRAAREAVRPRVIGRAAARVD